MICSLAVDSAGLEILGDFFHVFFFVVSAERLSVMDFRVARVFKVQDL